MIRWNLIIVVTALTGVDVTAQRPAPPLFERDVLPILNAHCLSCHGGLHQKGKLDLRTLAGLKLGGKNGAAVVAGDPDKSPLWTRVASDEMPPRPIRRPGRREPDLASDLHAGNRPVRMVAPGGAPIRELERG